MQRKKNIAILLVLCACLTLCGAGWFDDTKLAIDTEKHPVYAYCTADAMMAEFKNNEKIAITTYHGKYVLLSAKVRRVGQDGKNMIVFAPDVPEADIVCTYDKSLRDAALAYKAGERVAVYGRVQVGTFDKKVTIEAEKIIEAPEVVTSTQLYYQKDGSAFDKAAAKAVSLGGGNVEYYVPAHWESIQYDIQAEGFGSMEGYQYVLNQMPGSKDAVPESLFVCYFDNGTQLSNNSSRDPEALEKAIVENVLGSVGRFPSKEVKTYYGSAYDYYAGSYKTIFGNGEGYHTEFVFQADAEEGIAVVLYVYKEAKHLSDVMFLTRFLEVK